MMRNTALRRLLRAPACLYRVRLGRVLGRRFLLLVHVGRRTGRRHRTVLEIMEYRSTGPAAIVMSAFGRSADWLRNIQAASGAEVTIGSQRFDAIYRILDIDAAVAVVQRYERRNWLIAPIVRLVLSRLLGWRYHGSEIECRRLVSQLPLIVLYPRPISPVCGNC